MRPTSSSQMPTGTDAIQEGSQGQSRLRGALSPALTAPIGNVPLFFCAARFSLWRFKAEDDLISHDLSGGKLRADYPSPVALLDMTFIDFLLVVLELGLT